jgi:EpsI family protein
MRESLYRSYMPALILLVGVLFVVGARGQRAVPLAGSLEGILPALESYRVQDQHVTDAERKVAGMTEYVARAYWAGARVAFTTYIGYYDRQTQGKSIHSPRNCLPGAGWEIVSAGERTVHAGLGSRTVNRYLLKNGRTQAVVYYWYQGRGRVVASEYAVKLNLLRDAALRGHTEEALVRVVVPLDSTANAGALADSLGARIASRLMDDVERVLPRAEATSSTLAVGKAAQP